MPQILSFTTSGNSVYPGAKARRKNKWMGANEMKVIRNLITVTVLCVIGALFVWAPTASADVITINNASFEDPALADGAWIVGNGNTDPTLSNIPGGWISGGSATAGVFNPESSRYSSGSPTGENVAFLNSDSSWLYQDLAEVIEAGYTYTLYFDAALRTDAGSSFDTWLVGLRTGGNVGIEAFNGADHSGILNVGEWTDDLSVSYTALAGDAFIGQNLRVVLSNYGDGPQINFDNLRLEKTSASVPEPGTLALLGIGLLALGFIRLRRQKTSIV
jgi:hypothetical protein